MNGPISLITGFVLHHPSAALVVAFAAAVLEGVAIVGALVPGTAVMMTVAGVAATAGLPKLPFLLVAAAGAAVGDVFSYWVGSRYGGHLRRIWPLSRYPRVLARAEGFFAGFGTPSVFLARFVLGLRAVVPLVAGMAGMELRWFLAADLFAAVVWAPMHILPVQFAGLAIDRIRAGDWRAAAAIGVVLLLLAAIGYVMHKIVHQQTRLARMRSQSPPVSRSRRDAAAG